jgi:hypothetical protein
MYALPSLSSTTTSSSYTDHYQAVVIPNDVLLNAKGSDVANEFFQRTLGTLSPDSKVAERVTAAFMAISALGNVIVMTFTASRGSSSLLPLPSHFTNTCNTISEAGALQRRVLALAKTIRAVSELVHWEIA